MLLSDRSSFGRVCSPFEQRFSSACFRLTLWVAVPVLAALSLLPQAAQAGSSAAGIVVGTPCTYPDTISVQSPFGGNTVAGIEPAGSITLLPYSGIQGALTSSGSLIGYSSPGNYQVASLPATEGSNWSTSGTLTVSGSEVVISGGTITTPDATVTGTTGNPIALPDGTLDAAPLEPPLTTIPVEFPQSPPLAVQFLGLSEAGSGINLSHATSHLVINGAHSNPLARRVAEGQHNFWLAGDWGNDDHGMRDGDLGLAEFGFAHNFGHSQLGVSLGRTWAQQNLSLGGQAKNRGTYVLFEALIPVSSKLWATLNAYGQWGEARLTRNYMNGALIESSSGNPDAASWGVRMRADLENAYRVGSSDFSPYVSLSYSKVKQDDYAETGGSFPVAFNVIKAKSTELSLGVNIAIPLNNEISLLGLLEGTHRFESEDASISGQINGLGNFGIAVTRIKRDWVRAMFGINSSLAQGKATLSINMTSQGEAPNVWLAAGWQRPF